MNKFNSNPLRGVTIDNGWNGAIKDSSGNILLEREGHSWSENDQMGYDLLMKQMDYDYQADLMNYQNQYNSPAEQAKRLREAGINPDLQQIQNQPSASSSASAPTTQLNEGAEFARNLSIARDVLQSLPSAIQMYQQIESNNLDLSLKDLRVADEADKIARREIGKQLTLDDLKDKFSNPHLNLNGYSKRMQKRIQTEIDNYVWDVNNREVARGIVYDAKKDAEAKRQGYLDILGRHGFSLDDDVFLGIIKEVNTAIHDANKGRLDYEKDYYNSASGTSKGQAEKSQYELSKKKSDNDIAATLFQKANELMDSKDSKDQLKGGLLYIGLLFAQSKGLR